MNYPDGFQADVHGKKPICGVLAVAMCAGVSYDVANATLRRAKIALELGVRHGGRTWHIQRLKALDWLAVRYTDYKLGRPMTLGNWAEELAEPGVTYMVNVTGHVVTVKDGFVVDQRDRLPVNRHKSRRQQVKNVTRIDGKGW